MSCIEEGNHPLGPEGRQRSTHCFDCATESIVVDLAENVSSRQLIAIKALNTAKSYSAGLRTQRNSMLLNGRHLIVLCE
jgi:hypothetical protein